MIFILLKKVQLQHHTLADPEGAHQARAPLRPQTYDFFMPKTLTFLIFFFARD